MNIRIKPAVYRSAVLIILSMTVILGAAVLLTGCGRGSEGTPGSPPALEAEGDTGAEWKTAPADEGKDQTGDDAGFQTGDGVRDHSDTGSEKITADETGTFEAYAETVSSPDGMGGGHELPPEEDPDYHLEKLRLARWEWKESADGKVSYRGKTYKRKSYVKAILGMGIDTYKKFDEEIPVPDDRGVCDGIFLIAQDQSAKTLRVLMIPRSTITEIDRYGEAESYQGNVLDYLCVAYSQFSDTKKGCLNMVSAVSDMLCGLKIDHYAAVNLNVIADMTDAVGGVTVTVPNDQMVNGYPEWTKGKRITLRGDAAEHFLRYRYMRDGDPAGDDSALVRMSQHKEYIIGFSEAVRKKYSTDSSILLKMYDILEENMTTDLQKGELLTIGRDALICGLSGKDIVTVSGEYEDREYLEFYADYESLIPEILDMFYSEVD